VRPVRELAGNPVTQVVLGGDSGASLRDLLAAAALLKSKRVPPRLDFLVAPPSRQALEVLAQSGALVDLIATGARILEPDPRLLTGELYPPPTQGVSMRTFDPEPDQPPNRAVIASAETLAYAVATGSAGDPRSFKRPVRVTVPRTLPTDDVLIVRKGKGKGKEGDGSRTAALEAPLAHGWQSAETLPLVVRRDRPERPSALVLDTLDDVRWVARRASELCPTVRAVIAPHIPSGVVALLAGTGILALRAAPDTIRVLQGQASVGLPAPSEWNGGRTFSVSAGGKALELTWLALGPERGWTTAGSAKSASAPTATIKR
jgi:aconitate hydratase